MMCTLCSVSLAVHIVQLCVLQFASVHQCVVSKLTCLSDDISPPSALHPSFTQVTLKSGAVVLDYNCFAGGFQALSCRLELHASSNKLPTSHTCALRMNIPHCLHLEEMSSALSTAVAHHAAGFGFV